MSTATQAALAPLVAAAAQAAGLSVTETTSGTDFVGKPTTRFTLALNSNPSKTEALEFSEAFDFGRPELAAELKLYFFEASRRLLNPDPNVYVTLGGLPLRFNSFKWPFHKSTSGADTNLVHGEVKLEDGNDSPLHAKVSASMTVTFEDIVAAPEQPFAEGFIYNAIRKTMDQGQLELVKSGNRQPVPVTTRYYSRWQKKFTFNDTDESQRQDYLASKAFWLSGVLGNNAPVWMLDPRDAQYLNTTIDELKKSVHALAGEGLIQLAQDTEFATPTAALMSHRAEYESVMTHALDFLKPTFNEDMRHGHTNM